MCVLGGACTFFSQVLSLKTQTAAFQVWCANSPSVVSWTRCLTLIAPESNVHIHSLVAESAVLTSI